MRAVCVGLLACLGLCLSSCAAGVSAREVHPKRLIEFGWDEPDTRFMREHIAEMERTPFDGCVFHLLYTEPNGSRGNFMWEAWGKRSFSAAELQPALDDLQATPLHRF